MIRRLADRGRAFVLAVPVAIAIVFTSAADVAAKARPQLSALFGGPFTLVDHKGIERTALSFRGHFMLVNFGYTYCPDICPTALTTLAVALDRLGPAAAAVQPIFITVDPARDTSDQLAGYVSAFHPRLIGLTGSEAQIRGAAKAYRVHRSKILIPGEATEDYLVNHSSLTFLMDRQGQFVTMFPHGTDADFMAAAIRRHMAEEPAQTGRQAEAAN